MEDVEDIIDVDVDMDPDLENIKNSEEEHSKLYSIKELAELLGCSQQAIYNSIKRPTVYPLVKDHIFKKNNKKYFDEYALNVMKKNRVKNPTVIVKVKDQEKIDELENTNKILQSKLFELQEKYSTELKTQNDKILELTNELRLITQKNEEEIAETNKIKKELEQTKEQLTNELEEQRTISKKEKEELSNSLDIAQKEIDRLRNRNLFERIFNK